ncbi:MAG: multicopper oxidase domain-containing protein [Sporichthyaceae bacterium]
MNRRQFLRVGLGVTGAAMVGGCASSPATPVDPAGPEAKAAQGRRGSGGPVRAVALAPMVGMVDLGGPQVLTWTYGGALPGEAIRVRRGEVLEAKLSNRLPVETTVHWHGLALRNDMDGVPGVTQPQIAAGGEFTYRFTAEDPGTYWLHPHSGLQLDRGLYAPLIVEDPDEPARYDREWVVVLDDWLDGVEGRSPDKVFNELRASTMDHGAGGGSGDGGMQMGGSTMSGTVVTSPIASASAPPPTAGGMLMGATSDLLGGAAGDVAYPYYLINGRVREAPVTFDAKPGERIRIRLINAGGDTAFRVALGGHRLRVTHTDGYPVGPVETDALLIGMGERYDVEATLADGVFPLVALAEGKDRTALALIRTSSGAVPPTDVRPTELDRPVLRYDQLVRTEEVALAPRKIDREHRLELTGGMMGYSWGINGRPFHDGEPLLVEQDQRVRLSFVNRTMMWHPMHLHGHTFQMNGTGPRKDTVAVLPQQTVTCDFDANNPGQWMIHCHNAYHLEGGMMRTLAYTT